MDTARIARAAGAEVIERSDAERRGKGYALAFGIDHLTPSPPDVLIVIDADCRLTPGTIDALVQRAVETHRPVQADYVLQPTERSPISMISASGISRAQSCEAARTPSLGPTLPAGRHRNGVSVERSARRPRLGGEHRRRPRHGHRARAARTRAGALHRRRGAKRASERAKRGHAAAAALGARTDRHASTVRSAPHPRRDCAAEGRD